MILSSYESFMKDGKKTYNIDGQQVNASEAFNKVKQILHDGFKQGLSQAGNKVGLPKGFVNLGKTAGKFVSKFVAGFELAKAAWEMGNLLSPVEYATYENDFGNGQKLYYQTTEFKIPVLNIPLNIIEDYTKHIHQIEVFKNQVPFKNENDKPLDLYVVLGTLYNGKENAEEYLKHYIIQNPTKFVSTRQYYVNIMSQQEQKQITVDPEKKDGWDKLTEFTNEMFNKYFASKVVKMYFDGIDGFYTSAVDAKNSMKQKISHNQFIIKYKFTDTEGISKYYDDVESLLADQDKYNETYLLKSKTILTSDLVKTIKYNKLTEQLGVTSKVYEIIFNGQAKYFLTKEDAKGYINRNSDVTYKEENTINYHVYFDDATFNNEADFYKWVKDNTVMVNDNGEVIKND